MATMGLFSTKLGNKTGVRPQWNTSLGLDRSSANSCWKNHADMWCGWSGAAPHAAGTSTHAPARATH